MELPQQQRVASFNIHRNEHGIELIIYSTTMNIGNQESKPKGWKPAPDDQLEGKVTGIITSAWYPSRLSLRCDVVHSMAYS